VLRYAGDVSVEENLARLRDFCARDTAPATLEERLKPFGWEFVRHLRGREADVAAWLQDRAAPPHYRLVLLYAASLYEVPGREELAWAWAMDTNEPPLIAHNAAVLIGKVPPGLPRPDDYRRLLARADPVAQTFLLRVASRHADTAGWALVRELAGAGDVNVRRAAMAAAASPEHPDRVRFLEEAIATPPATAGPPLGPDAVVKRQAVLGLDPADTAQAAALRRLADDRGEDPTVRAAAVQVLNAGGNEEDIEVVRRLVETEPEENLVVLATAARALAGRADGRAAVEKRCTESGPDAARVLRQALEQAETRKEDRT
jgi:hypothetical protein